jgi:two-component system NtrC family sensor kinase
MKVLLAEDSATMRALLVSQLREWEYDITQAVDGVQAWELFEHGDFQLVLTDWMMPEMDGLELIRRIRAAYGHGYVYIVLLTAKVEKDDLVQAMEAGADDFLVKPCDQEELRVRLREGERIIRLERRLEEQNQQLREAQASLVQSEKLASVGQLASGMAHEINNPIAFVTNNLAVIKRDVSDVMRLLSLYESCREQMKQAGAAEALQEIQALEQESDLPWLKENLPRLFESSLKGLSRVREIVNNLREFAHLDEAEYDQMDVTTAIESTLEVLKSDIEAKKIRVQRNYGDSLKILCQPAKIKQLFYSVLLNAIQANPKGGSIAIGVEATETSARIDVTDEGCGMDDESIKKAFEPFYTTKPVGSGTGLGLAISYGIVRDHGGKISIDSQPGKGCTLHIELPTQPSKAVLMGTARLSQENSFL